MEYITKETVLKMLNKIENAVEDGEGYQFNEWVGYVKELPTYSANADGDLISRQAVIDIVEFECGEWIGLAKTIVKSIEQLPSEEKTDGDLISRTDLLNKIWQKEYGKDYDGVNMLDIPHIDIIEQMPSAENTAEWIDGKCNKCGTHAPFWSMSSTYYCSEYCPNCGCRMKEVEK